MNLRALPAPPGDEGATRNARRPLVEWARAQVEVTALPARIPPPAPGPSPDPVAAPLPAAAARGH